MELEIKNLVPYLPYGLKAEMLDYEKDYVGKKIDTIVGIHQWDKSGKLWCLLTEGGSKPSLDRIKPLLYPLEYLTKEIEVNGEKFVPREKEMLKKFEISDYNGFNFFDGFGGNENVYDLPFFVIQKLAEWHIDFQGLIPAGLAIDINTIKN
jgi:hypothetical protein